MAETLTVRTWTVAVLLSHARRQHRSKRNKAAGPENAPTPHTERCGMQTSDDDTSIAMH